MKKKRPSTRGLVAKSSQRCAFWLTTRGGVTKREPYVGEVFRKKKKWNVRKIKRIFIKMGRIEGRDNCVKGVRNVLYKKEKDILWAVSEWGNGPGRSGFSREAL